MSAPATPLVTVVLPVRDGARYLREAVDSILGQTFRDFELVIIDDGSEDETPAILLEYASRDSRVRVETQARLGITTALNRGIAHARGGFIARVDADDVSIPERLAYQVAFLERHPSVAVVGSSLELLGAPEKELTRLDQPTEPAAVSAALERGNCIAHPTVVFRSGPFRAVGGYRSAFVHAEDYDLWLRLSETHELANLPRPLVRYRLHGSQVTGANLVDQAVSTIAARATAQLRRTGSEPPLPDRVDLEFVRRLGVSDATIAVEIATAALTWSGWLAEAGLADPARPLRAVSDALQAIEDSGRAVSMLARGNARIAVRDGRLLAALHDTVRAARTDPPGTLAALRRRIRAHLSM